MKQNIDLKNASDTLKNDKDIVLEAIKNNGYSLEYASDRLKNDREIVLEAIKTDFWALKYASDTLKNDKEIVLEAIKNGNSLQYASNTLKNDKEIVLEAIKNNGYFLEYASDTLKNDREIVLKSIRKRKGYKTYSSFIYAGDILKHDKAFLKEEKKKDPDVFNFIDEEYKKDKAFIFVFNESRNCSNVLYEEFGISVSNIIGNSKNKQTISNENILLLKTMLQRFNASVKNLSALFKEHYAIFEFCKPFKSKGGDFCKEKMKIRAVLSKHDMEGTLSHEIGHFIDNHLGRKINRNYASEVENQLAWTIATEFKKLKIKEKHRWRSVYFNKQIECFARAIQQYYYEQNNIDYSKHYL